MTVRRYTLHGNGGKVTGGTGGYTACAISFPPEFKHLIGRTFICEVDEAGVHYILATTEELAAPPLPAWAREVEQ